MDLDLLRPRHATPVHVHVQEGEIVAVDAAECVQPARVGGCIGRAREGLGVPDDHAGDRRLHGRDEGAHVRGDLLDGPMTGVGAVVDMREVIGLIQGQQVDGAAGGRDAGCDAQSLFLAGKALHALAAVRGRVQRADLDGQRHAAAPDIGDGLPQLRVGGVGADPFTVELEDLHMSGSGLPWRIGLEERHEVFGADELAAGVYGHGRQGGEPDHRPRVHDGAHIQGWERGGRIDLAAAVAG